MSKRRGKPDVIRIHHLRKRTFIIAFLLPSVFLFLVIYAYPLINIFWTSMTKWNFENLNAPAFLGFEHMFDNYIRLFTEDYYFKTSLLNSFKWVGLQALIQVPFALIVALVLSKKARGWVLTRNSFIIPNIISTAAIGLIFLNLYDPGHGLVTEIIKIFNPESDINILAGEASAFWGVTFSFVLFGGTQCLLILAQIMSIPKEIYEAAKVDGVNAIQADRYITLPLIKPIIGTSFILACNYGLILFNEVALITRGGPDNATYNLSYYIYKTAMGSSKLNFAYANTAGVIQFISGLIIIGLITWIFKTNRSYDSD